MNELKSMNMNINVNIKVEGEKKEALAVPEQEPESLKIIAIPKLTLPFEQGQKVKHSFLGEGIIVGFSSISGQPFVFFMNQQNVYHDKIVCVDYLNLISMV